jgi:hypothetical protein
MNSARATIILQPADIVIFNDKHFPADPDAEIDEVPVNRVAVVVDERGALSVGRGVLGRRVELLPLQAIPKLPHVQIRRLALGHTDEIAQFFRRHADRPTHFEAGLRALREENLQPLIEGGFFPTRPCYRTDDDYENAWCRFKANLKPLDFVFTLDLDSRLSRFIAWATDGAWSHAAVHVGRGEIWESVTSGIRNGPIEMYKGRRYWVAAYRHCDALKNPRSEQEVEDGVHAHPFRSNAYNYGAALRYGWKAFRGDHTHSLTPNSTVLQGNLVLVAHA